MRHLILVPLAVVLAGALVTGCRSSMKQVPLTPVPEERVPPAEADSAEPQVTEEVPIPSMPVCPPMRFDGAGAVTNSLGMQLVAIPEADVYMSMWETRVSDYRAFVSATGRDWPVAPFDQADDHPAVMVSWEDAAAFCRWLTASEHASGVLPAGQCYRLPSDAEWSVAVGLSAEVEDAGEATGRFPWGTDWPPPARVANYHPALEVDAFPFTAPVGSFAPGPYGLYDLGGNVWEWCQDLYNNSPDFRVLRGASWRMKTPSDLLADTRVGNTTSVRLNAYGFRVVIDAIR